MKVRTKSTHWLSAEQLQEIPHLYKILLNWFNEKLEGLV